MLQTTIGKLHTVDACPYRLYVIKNGEHDVLYVGQSNKIKSRIRQHASSDTLLGRALSTNRPQSSEWEVNLYTVDECMDLIKQYFPYAPKASQWESETKIRDMADFAEDALIYSLNPRYNLATNIGCNWSAPTRELHPETQAYQEAKWKAKQEAEAEQRRKYKEYQDRLINTPCTICGKYDKWVRCIDNTPVGVLDSKDVYDGETYVRIPFVCHDCNSVINNMNDLHRSMDTVRKIKKAIRKYRQQRKSSPALIQYSQMTLNFDVDNCA